MARHRCEVWTRLGLDCPAGAIKDLAKKKKKRKERKEERDESLEFHKSADRRPARVDQFVYVKVLRRVFELLRGLEARKEGFIDLPEEEEMVHARDIPIKEVLRMPIPEIAITGATAAAIMAAAKAFGMGNAESVVTRMLQTQMTRGRGTTTRPGGPIVGGMPMHFNAAEDLRRRLLRQERGGSGEFFPGILG